MSPAVDSSTRESHAPWEGLLVERRDEHPIGDDLLDLVQQRLALLAVELVRLPLEEIVDLRDGRRRRRCRLGEEGLEPGGGIARGAGGADERVP